MTSRSTARIRPMQYEDLQAVVAIEQAAHITPWSASTLRDCVRAGYACDVVIDDGQVAAFSVTRVGPFDTELLNICVAPHAQRQGLGQRLLHAVVDRAKRAGSERVLLDVRVSNGGAIALYRKRGFEGAGLREGYYRCAAGELENALVMALDLSASGNAIL